MIQSIELKNFKSIKKKYFPLRNLNILLGLNGQGKSSFIQSLLLLRQSDKLPQGELKLNGGENGLINIGTTKDALYQYSKDEELSISLQFTDTESYKMNFNYEIDADVFKQNNLPTEIKENYILNNIKQSLFNNNFQYLNAQRVEPQSLNITSHSNVVDAKSLGKYGQYTAHYIELRANEDILFDNLLHRDSKIFDLITEKVLINQYFVQNLVIYLIYRKITDYLLG